MDKTSGGEQALPPALVRLNDEQVGDLLDFGERETPATARSPDTAPPSTGDQPEVAR
jgi:hypothetical protein